MNHWCGKDFDFFDRGQCVLHQELRKYLLSENKVSVLFLRKKSAVFQQEELDEMGVLMLWRTRAHMDISLAMIHSCQHIQNFD